ncbi:ecdysteroid 22-kinase family protein [Ferribacterium limneticum]|uniref:ecdysteroid 22-kinase family protein n=1 Tax=Ferribacterium limneticum TaxID=76259 RepID=UPI001CF9019E|nr:ecdysteroid 22-kinase family protein [Ferribacterium limneticum]UCV23604.1 phosphotransferase [Ferribacterium limneticum]
MTHLIPEIQAAYERDQRLKTEAITADDLPLSFESITDRWLTAVLCHSVPGAKVIGHQLGPVDTGSSNRRRIEVEYNDAGVGAGLPWALFCKASHELANRIVLGVSGGAFTEGHFYNQIRPHLEIEAPRSFFAHFDPVSFNSMIMLGDLTSSVTEFCNHKTVMTLERARSQMRLLGKLHGISHSHPDIRAQLEHLPTWPDYFKNTEAFGMEAGSSNGFLAGEEVIPPRLYQRYEEIWPATMRSMELHSSWPNCLSHGDVHLKNWYVAGSGEMGLSDWQCATRGHWARDVAYTMSTALTVEDRRRWEKELIKYYLEEMHVAGGPKVSFNEGWNAYRQQLITALTWWTITLSPTKDMPDMQPRDITLEFIRRISTAMDDLDTLDAMDR